MGISSAYARETVVLPIPEDREFGCGDTGLKSGSPGHGGLSGKAADRSLQDTDTEELSHV
jgi:hypothetical protein